MEERTRTFSWIPRVRETPVETVRIDATQPEPHSDFGPDAGTLRSSTSFSSVIASIFFRSSTCISRRSDTLYSNSSLSSGSETLYSSPSFTSGSAALCSTSSHANDNKTLCSISEPSPDKRLGTWYDPPDATVDICFVHGPYGNQNTTWTAKGRSEPWPRKLLPSRLHRARILTYAYHSGVLREPAKWPEHIPEIAADLLAELTRDRTSRCVFSRPLIFVAYDVGGLICKEVLLLSRHSPSVRLWSLADSVRGVVFMGTPHRAATVEECELVPLFSALGFYGIAGRCPPGNTPAGAAYLGALEDRFRSVVEEQEGKGERLRVACFYAELPTRGLGWMAVPRGSAAPEGYLAVGIHTEQRDVARFATSGENGFKRLFGELARWVRGIEGAQPGRAVAGSGKLDPSDCKSMFGGSELSCVECGGDSEAVEMRIGDGAGAETWSTGRTTLFGWQEEQCSLEGGIS